MRTDYLVFSPEYCGTVLLGDVVEAAEEIIDEENKKAPFGCKSIVSYG